MRFPPPIRITAPLLALVFGLSATWFDYRLNLDLDLARHLDEARMRARAHGARLALLGDKLVVSGQLSALQADMEAMSTLPNFLAAAVVDSNGMVLADSAPSFVGKHISETRLLDPARLMSPPTTGVARQGENERNVFGAHSFSLGPNQIGWILLEFDITEAETNASKDALAQLRWMASAMTLLSFALWAVLHFGFADRLSRLAQLIRAFGERRADLSRVPRGSDEVGELSRAFLGMADQLSKQAAEQVRLEREALESTEREQRRIGHDLHDGLGQRLTAASLATNALIAAMRTENLALVSRAEDIGRQLRDAIAETRALSHGLAPVALADEGLMSALRALAAGTSRNGVNCVFECPEPVQVPDIEIAGHIYRIAQEAVHNALKHAEPSEIRIGLERREGDLILEVDDDGEGFEAGQNGDGIGLRGMQHRAQLIGGHLEIGSPPAGGTRIFCQVRLPL